MNKYKSRLYLIDATAFCYRAFFALRGLTTSFGQPTNAVYGFVNILNKILKENNPELLAACFDISRDTFRQKKFAEYKIQRPPMPEGLSSQIPIIKQIISAYGITILEKKGYEADDIIATMVKLAKQNGLSITIISSDKDVLQLVDEDTTVFSPYKNEGQFYDTNQVFERYGVKPNQIVDMIALMGDDADNIPGLSGIGEKTAVELIRKFGSLDNLLTDVNRIDKDKLRKTIEDNINQIELNRELVNLHRDVDINFNLEALRIGKPDLKELIRLFRYLEFRTFLKDLSIEDNSPAQIKVEISKDAAFKKLIDEVKELFICGEGLNDLIFYAQNKFLRLEDRTNTNLKFLLSAPGIKKIGHDLKKIKASLYKDDVVLSGIYFDTMVASHLLNPSKPEYKLADIAWDYLNNPPLSVSMDNQTSINLMLKLKPVLEKELKEKSLLDLFNNIEIPLIEVLAEMEQNGIKLDLEVLRSLSFDIEKRLIKLIEEIYDLSGCQFNINSPKQLRDILFVRLKLPVIKKNKTGPSTDEEVLRKLADKHELPALLLEYRQLMKLKTTYIDALPVLVNPVTGRVHTSFNQTATETGRLSSSNPNLQNIPIKTDIGRNIRRAIIASCKDNYLLSCDYSQIELRILAHLSKDQNLTLAFKENKDIHRATASLIYGLDEFDITDTMRDVAKRVNFGIVYGLSSYGLSRDLNIPVSEAQCFIDAYFLRYPKVKEYIQEQIENAQKNGFVTTIAGRRRYIPEINNKNQGIRQFAERQAINTPIQGSASDMIKLAMIHIHKEIHKRKLKTKMILQVHDELIFDTPGKETEELVHLIRDRMENVMELDVPVKVDIKKGENWLEMEEVK